MERLVVITGLSGSGKSLAARCLEDMNYFCVDNLPVNLIPQFYDLLHRSGTAIPCGAIVVDAREREFLGEFPETLAALKTNGAPVTLLFFECTEETLKRRFSESRRPHPMQEAGGSLEKAIQDERAILAPLRDVADRIIDTSRFNAHELRSFLKASFGEHHTATALNVHLVSFGFKYGVPAEADLLFDVRFIPNPFFVEGLRAGRPQRRGAPLPGRPARGARVRHPRPGPPRFPGPPLRLRGEELPDDHDRLHGGQAPFGGPGRSHSRTFRRQGRAGLGDASRPREGVTSMAERAPGLLVVTHGRLAGELESAARRIVGHVAALASVSLDWDDDVTDARRRIEEAIHKVAVDGRVLILTDMFGGTPSNVALSLLEPGRVDVVTGVNLPMLIKFANLHAVDGFDETVRRIAQQGRDAIQVASEVLEKRVGPDPSPGR